ncbi:hypothetical protein CC2G_004410 [Coprinopsis cinerea AmutBmut pab1-1]|nr:hypothetical protein CC2G_004410 [Coprinopsis cinerea AmutBmut pab1-1]
MSHIPPLGGPDIKAGRLIVSFLPSNHHPTRFLPLYTTFNAYSCEATRRYPKAVPTHPMAKRLTEEEKARRDQEKQQKQAEKAAQAAKKKEEGAAKGKQGAARGRRKQPKTPEIVPSDDDDGGLSDIVIVGTSGGSAGPHVRALHVRRRRPRLRSKETMQETPARARSGDDGLGEQMDVDREKTIEAPTSTKGGSEKGKKATKKKTVTVDEEEQSMTLEQRLERRSNIHDDMARMLEARGEVAGHYMDLQVTVASSFLGYALVYMGGGPAFSNQQLQTFTANRSKFLRRGIYQFEGSDDANLRFVSTLPLEYRTYNTRPLVKSVFDELMAAGPNLAPQAFEHAIVLALPASVIDKASTFSEELPKFPWDVKKLRINRDAVEEYNKKHPNEPAAAHLVNGAHRGEVTEALTKEMRAAWADLLAAAAETESGEEKQRLLDAIRKDTKLLEETGFWCAKIYDLDFLRSAKHGIEGLRMLAANPDFASSPDRPFDTLRNTVTVLITLPAEYKVWKKQISYLPSEPLLRSLLTDALSRSKTSYTHLQRTRTARELNASSPPASSVPAGSSYDPSFVQMDYDSLGPSFWEAVDKAYADKLKPFFVSFATPRVHLEEESAGWLKAVSAFYDTVHGWLVENADRAKKAEETGLKIPHHDAILLMPERLRKIQESIAKKEDGEWALPIYVPQFVSKLVEDLRSRTEGIKVVISLVDPGFLAPIHGNNKYDYTIEDVARWIATHPKDGVTNPGDLMEDDCSEAILDGFRKVIFRYRNSALVDWTKGSSASGWLGKGAPMGVGLSKLSAVVEYSNPVQEAVKYVPLLLREYAALQSEHEANHVGQYPELAPSVKARNGTYYPIAPKSIPDDNRPKLPTFIPSTTVGLRRSSPDLGALGWLGLPVNPTKRTTCVPCPPPPRSGRLVALPKLAEMVKTDALTWAVYSELLEVIHTHRKDWTPWHGIGKDKHIATSESSQLFNERKVQDYKEAHDLDSLVRGQTIEMARFYNTLVRSFAISYTVSVKEKGKHVQKSFTRIPVGARNDFISALRRACYKCMLERMRFSKVTLAGGKKMRIDATDLTIMDDVLKSEFNITVPPEDSEMFMSLTDLQNAVRPLKKKEKVLALMGQGPAEPVRSSKLGVAVPIPNAPNYKVKKPKVKKQAQRLPQGGVTLMNVEGDNDEEMESVQAEENEHEEENEENEDDGEQEEDDDENQGEDDDEDEGEDDEGDDEGEGDEGRGRRRRRRRGRGRGRRRGRRRRRG